MSDAVITRFEKIIDRHNQLTMELTYLDKVLNITQGCTEDKSDTDEVCVIIYSYSIHLPRDMVYTVLAAQKDSVANQLRRLEQIMAEMLEVSGDCATDF